MDTAAASSSCTCVPDTPNTDAVKHPLDPLTAAEISAVIRIVSSRRSNFSNLRNRSYVSTSPEIP